MRENNLRIGIDLGGTKIEALLTDSAGNEIRRARVKTPPKILHNMRRSQKKWFIVIILKTDDEMGIRWANFWLFLSLSKLSIS